MPFQGRVANVLPLQFFASLCKRWKMQYNALQISYLMAGKHLKLQQKNILD